ncbi:hypothetical protein ID866_12592, partial [Astraeus odoratus]
MVTKEQEEVHGDNGQGIVVQSEMQRGKADATRSTMGSEWGSGIVKEAREDTVSKALEDAKSGIQQAQGVPEMVERYTNVVGVANNALQQTDIFDATYLQPLQTFNAVVKAIADTIIAQVNRDASVNALLLKICEFYSFITEDGRIVKLTSMQVALKNMAEQILDCARFIKDYSETKSFWIRLGKNVLSETDAIVTKYNLALDGLMQGFRDQAIRDTHITIHQVLADLERLGETVELNSIAYATGAGLNTSKKCLEDTRIEILGEIVDWINDHGDAARRIFWLSGQAGKGKSAIAH